MTSQFVCGPRSGKFFAELLGTFGLVFFGCGAIVLASEFPGTLPPFMVPAIFGLVVAAMIYTLGHVSGAHLNPAVTLGFALIGRFPKNQILSYWLAQVLGSILAVALISVVFPASSTWGETVPRFGIGSALLIETILTFFLMLVITSTATDDRAQGVMAGTAIGITVAICAWIGGPLSGASMNPARSIGPALFAVKLDTLWIYLLGPFVGASLGAFTYVLIRCVPTESNSRQCPE